MKTFHLDAAVAGPCNVAVTVTATVAGHGRVRETDPEAEPGSPAGLEQGKGIGRNRSTKHAAHTGSPPQNSKRPGKYWQPCWQPSSRGFGPVFCRRKNPPAPAYEADPHPYLGTRTAKAAPACLTMQQNPGPRSGTLSLRPQAA
jgi:hypothetical protein